MNKEAIRYVAKALRNGALTELGIFYHQGYFGRNKGDCHRSPWDHLPRAYHTVACIAGYADSLLELDGTPKAVPSIPCLVSGVTAIRILGLTEKQAEKLFLSSSGMGANGHVTREQAAHVLEYFANTGRITWKKFVPEGVQS